MYGWLSGGSPEYAACSRELHHRNLYVLPDGIAGIFLARPGSHRVLFRARRGVIKLALEHGATLVPIYTFGLSECFSTFTGSADPRGGWLSRFCRRYRIGVCLFWGQWGLPIPRRTRISFVFGRGIKAPKVEAGKALDPAVVDGLHAAFCASLREAFDKHKADAGFPNAELEIV